MKIRFRYGLTLDEYAQLEEDQDWICAICKSEKRLNLDHNHATGKVRQFLCHRCNIGLAALESPLFAEMRAYLAKHAA